MKLHPGRLGRNPPFPNSQASSLGPWLFLAIIVGIACSGQPDPEAEKRALCDGAQNQGTLTVAPEQVGPWGDVTIRGSGFPPSAALTVNLVHTTAQSRTSSGWPASTDAAGTFELVAQSKRVGGFIYWPSSFQASQGRQPTVLVGLWLVEVVQDNQVLACGTFEVLPGDPYEGVQIRNHV